MNKIENGKMIFGYLAIMLESDSPWDPQTVYHQNRAVPDENRNWWISRKSTEDEPNLNHPIPGFGEDGRPVASEWWALWIDWQHPMAVLETAAREAADAAREASEKAGEAKEAADRADAVDVSDHERRIAAMEMALGSVTEADVTDIAGRVESLEGLIGADVDGVVNKFEEIVAAFAGIGDTETVKGLLAELAAKIAEKQDSGDYATNGRVDEVEARMAKYAVPHFEGDALAFPAENGAHFEEDALILTV